MEILRFALLGLATGAIYAVLAQGLVLVYRGSGLLNFAQGAMAMVGAYIYYELAVKCNVPLFLAMVVAVLACAVLGAAIHYLLVGPMRRASPLSRVVVTLGLLIVAESAATIIFGVGELAVPSLLPTHIINVFSHQLPIGEDKIIIFVIGVLLTGVLWWVYRHTSFGRVTTAVAENQVVAASLGHSPDRVAAINWAVGSALAALAGVLFAPTLFLDPVTLPLLVLPAMAGALLGQFSSFPLTLAMALAIGVANSEINRYVSAPGWSYAAPFIAVIVMLVLRGTTLPLRSFVLDRLPRVSSGRIRPLPALILFAVAFLVTAQASADWALALTTTFAIAIVCLSVVVVCGYAGQLSLAQHVLAGVGALIAAKLALHMGFLPAVLLAAAATGLVGVALGLPSLRTRGITLAIVTLGLGAAVFYVVLQNPGYTGGVQGILVPLPHLFGWDLDPFAHDVRYALVTLVLLGLLCVGVMNLRRGRVGRRLVAVRSNERAAASLGVSVAGAKIYAFGVAGAIAALGGSMLAFVQPSIIVSNVPGFDVFSSILITAIVVAGAVGSVSGALIGALLFEGGILSQAFSGWSQVNEYLPLIGGVVLLVVLRIDPDGISSIVGRLTGVITRPLAPVLGPVNQRLSALNPLNRRVLIEPAPSRTASRGQTGTTRTSAQTSTRQALTVNAVSVRFGGVTALENVSIEVRPGEVHGLIGPNGAGKTTLIDAITGFNRPSAGTIRVGDDDLTRAGARRRALAGLSRSFQSLELFEDLTVMENIIVAAERPRPWHYLADFIAPGRLRVSGPAADAVRDLELSDIADALPAKLSYGRRKEVAIARAIANGPSVLLLDEPAAGLDDHEAAEFAALIRRLATERGIAVLLVEHKIDMIMSISDRVSVLVGGRLLTSGTPDEVRSNPNVLDAYLGHPIAAAA